MGAVGPEGFWVYLFVIMALLTAYVGYRMTQRQSLYAAEDDYDAVAYAPVFASATPLVGEVVQEVYVENAESDGDDDNDTESPLDPN